MVILKGLICRKVGQSKDRSTKCVDKMCICIPNCQEKYHTLVCTEEKNQICCISHTVKNNNHNPFESISTFYTFLFVFP